MNFRHLLFLSYFVGTAFTATQGQAGAGLIPDIPGFQTLKCDFHIHTVFSDGKVWPTVRVAEAINEGLDAIAITDHIKYGKQGKYSPDVKGDRNRSFELAAAAAKNTDLIVIKGAEITQGMPPGHINAIFLQDAAIDQADYFKSFREAKAQGAFIFWNHPLWRSPDKKWEQDGIAQWFDTHTDLLKNGILMGIEVVNAKSYNQEAHRWCIDKNLTLIANSDIHEPIGMEYDLAKEHRPTTLVFAKERSETGIKEALQNQRTALWFEDNIIGSEALLSPLFKECVKVEKVEYLEKLAVVTLRNTSDLSFFLENQSEYSFFNKANFIVIKGKEELHLMVKTGEVLEKFQLLFEVKNMLTAPNEYLTVSLDCKKTGIIKDKKQVK